MKLGKEEIQKVVLGLIMLIALVYCYFNLLLGPLEASHEGTRKKIEDLHGKLAEAKKQISRTQALETTAPSHALKLKQLTALIPDGSPVAWFPTRVADFFKQYGVDKAITRLNSEAPAKDFTGFRDTTWGVEFQRVDFVPLGQALAHWENDQPLTEISTLQMDCLKDDVEAQHVVLTLNNLVKQ